MPLFPAKGILSKQVSLSALSCFVRGGGEHGGQANNQSEPSPELLPRWGSYLTLAWGSPWEQHWTSRYEFVPLPQKSVPPRRPACLRHASWKAAKTEREQGAFCACLHMQANRPFMFASASNSLRSELILVCHKTK